MRSDVSEDPKGDPTKQVGRDAPSRQRPPGVEPLLPPEDREAAPSADEEADGDDDEDITEVTFSDRVEGGPEHAPSDDDETPAPERAPPPRR
jgi:hypothetical protein